MQRLHQIRLAIMMLTRLPMGRLPDPVPTLSEAAWAFPLVGVITGGFAWAAFHATLSLGMAPALAAFIAIATVTVLTGALHEDGLADFADGIGGGRDRAHCLEIMRDSRIGSYGVVALVLMIGLKASALAELGDQASASAFIFVAVASRLLMLATLVMLPSARTDGLGQSATGASPKSLVAGTAVMVLCGIALGFPVFVVACAAGLVAILVGALAQNRIRGQTGDVLGAVQKCAETAGFVVLSSFA